MNTVKFDKQNVRMVAHRGLSGIETENTNAAFVAAGNRSYYGIETDIYRSADGHFVVNHDGDLVRIGGERICAEAVSADVFQSIVLFDKDGTKNRRDLRPSTLENYINICKKYEKQCILELKSAFSDEEIEKIIAIITDMGYIDGVTFISFNYDNLLKVRRVRPEQSAQYLFGGLSDEIFDMLVRDRIDADMHFPALSNEVVNKLHTAGLKVNCWTVDSAADGERLAKMGVDFITSNILE